MFLVKLVLFVRQYPMKLTLEQSGVTSGFNFNDAFITASESVFTYNVFSNLAFLSMCI